MRSNDEAEFKRQAEVLMAGFPGYISDRETLVTALWRGLQRMDLLLFARIVDHVLSGEAEIPAKAKLTPGLLWGLSRSMRSRGPTATTEAPLKSGDEFQVISTKMLWLFVFKKGPFTPEVLQQLLDAKRRLIDDYRLIAAEEEITDTEFGEAVYRKYATITGCTDIRFDDEPASLRRCA